MDPTHYSVGGADGLGTAGVSGHAPLPPIPYLTHRHGSGLWIQTAWFAGLAPPFISCDLEQVVLYVAASIHPYVK